MFHEFGIENFKSWKDKHYISINDISLLFGKNSSGKSSILQALMLLKASSKIFDPFNDSLKKMRRATPKAPINKLTFANTIRDFGSIDDIIHKNSQKIDGIQTFSFRIKPKEFTRASVDHLIKSGAINIDSSYANTKYDLRTKYELFVKKANLLIPKDCKFIEICLIFNKAVLQNIDICFDKESIARLKVSNGYFENVELTTNPKIWKDFLGVTGSDNEVHSNSIKNIEELNEKSSESLSSHKDRIFDLIHKFGDKPLFLKRPFSDIIALDSGAPNFFESAKNEFQKIEYAINDKSTLAIHIDDFVKNLLTDLGGVSERDIVTLTSIKKLNEKFHSLFNGSTGDLANDEDLEYDLLYPSVHLKQAVGRLIKLLSSSDWKRARFIHARKMASQSGAKNRKEYLAWIRKAQKDYSYNSLDVFSASLNPKEEFGDLFKTWTLFLGPWGGEFPDKYVHHEPFSKGNPREGKFLLDVLSDERLEELNSYYYEEARQIIQAAVRLCHHVGTYISSLEKLEEISFENKIFLETHKTISIEKFLETLKQVSFRNCNFLSPVQNKPLVRSITTTQFLDYNKRIGLYDLSDDSVMHLYTDLYATSTNRNDQNSRDINVFYLLTYAITYLSEGLESLEILGPHRPPPQRYIRGDSTVGNNAYLSILNNENKARPEQINLMNDALHLLEIPYSLSKKNDGEDNIYEEIKLLDKNNMEVSILDVGYGISQILPVIITAFTQRNKTILIEQPELHLHPKLQANLADIFAISTLSNKNKFLLETHSEHLLLRFMRRRRENFEDDLIKKGIDPSMLFLPSEEEMEEKLTPEVESKKPNKKKLKLKQMEKGHMFFRDDKETGVDSDGQIWEDFQGPTFFQDPDFYNNLYTLVNENKISVTAISINSHLATSSVSLIQLTNEGNYIGEWPDGFFPERHEELDI